MGEPKQRNPVCSIGHMKYNFLMVKVKFLFIYHTKLKSSNKRALGPKDCLGLLQFTLCLSVCCFSPFKEYYCMISNNQEKIVLLKAIFYFYFYNFSNYYIGVAIALILVGLVVLWLVLSLYKLFVGYYSCG